MSDSRKYQREWHQRKQRERSLSSSYRVGLMLARARVRAKRRGVPFSLSRLDIAIPRRCPVLGIVLRWRAEGRSGPSDHSPSLDEIVPGRGYVPGNVQVISTRANRIKQNATPRELLRVAKFYLRRKT